MPDGYLRHVPNTIGGGAQSRWRHCCDSPSRPTAIVAATDLLAMGLIHAAHARGLGVPEQLSIVGFDDIALTSGTFRA